MIISQAELFQKINATLIHLRRKNPIDIETGGTITTLEDTLNLLTITAFQLNLDEFPSSEKSCLDLIDKEENDLSEVDLEELKYLADSVRWALDVIG
ncbi:hypothetical protein DSCO28_25870 [Desulfosarcina ovata subsp. sediminis]|uniref:Uncharacterized protein n=1 Tax=Desulfosarcina ovata subsp. sediminis TaxID=885957 RepID=A0A5K7ZM15_9BACT|nr:hypothetical protein [Desulfosarcina ovata]BBO82021.1 hypothetical protein DSCO28_25870 [Desulfosarcina ovata subsp. sediminis]